MMSVYTEFMFWGSLGFLNLAISLLIYHSTRLSHRQKIHTTSSLSTTPIYTGPSFPSIFTYLSLITGLLNTAGSMLRFRRIHFLEVIRPGGVPWVAEAVHWISSLSGGAAASRLGGDGDMVGGGEDADWTEWKNLIDAEWLVAMNDWTSLFLALTFLLAACFNFLTVRQLILRDRRANEVLLPAPMRTPGTEGKFVNANFAVDEKMGDAYGFLRRR